MRWMLDTDSCIIIMKHHPPKVRERLRRVAIGEIGLSAVVPGELKFGLHNNRRRSENKAALDDFLGYCMVFDWPWEASEHLSGHPPRIAEGWNTYRLE